MFVLSGVHGGLLYLRPDYQPLGLGTGIAQIRSSVGEVREANAGATQAEEVFGE